MTHRIARAPVALVLAALALAACKGKEKAPESPAPPPAAPAPAPAAAAPSATIEVGRAIGPDKRVLAALDELGRRDTLYASVTTQGAPANAQLVATWTHESGQTVKVDTQAVAGPSGTAEFHVTKKSAWPTGAYTVGITLDGQPLGEKRFTVR